MASPDDKANKESQSEQELSEESLAERLDGSAQEDAEAILNAVADEPPSTADAELTPEQALQQALSEVEKFRDIALRSEAEMQNLQRRTARDIENAHKFGIERFLQNLLPVVDSIEKAIEVAEQSSAADDAMTEGLRLCHKLMLDVLAKESVQVIDPMGEPFDPNLHQAMSMVENPDMEPNSVFAVVQKGFTLNGRLVRAAMVMVTKAPAT